MTDYSNPSEVEWAEHLDRLGEAEDEHGYVEDEPEDDEAGKVDIAPEAFAALRETPPWKAAGQSLSEWLGGQQS